MQKSTTIIGVLEMLEDGFSYNDIRTRYSIGNSTITDIKKKFKTMDVTLKQLHSMTPKMVEQMFYPNAHPRKEAPLPDFEKVYKKLTDKNSKANLYFIWIDYKKLYPDGYQYTQFKHYFKQWLDENHLESNLRMAINRVPGEIMYIDWVGDTLDLVYTDVPGELQTAHFFTTTLGVSTYCFVMAFPNEQTPNFLQGTIEALNFYGGVPKILKPDNTKAASIKNTKDVLILNKVYEDLQDYYNTVIVPAPPLKPRAKSTVENNVKWIETHLLEKLKGRRFSSFSELNAEISIIIDELNNREFSKEKGNRKELFDKYDKPALKPLPHESLKPYTYVIKTVPNNYHVEYDHHYYSVPHTYYKQEVTLKASYFDIIICDSMNHLICTHKRAYKPFPKYITKEEHMPESHRYYYLENKMNAESYKSWAKSYGPNVYELICMVIGTFRYEEQSYKSCNGILHLCKNNPKVFSDTAAKTCLESHIYNYTHFKKQLYNLMNQKKTNSSGTLPEHKNIRGKSHYE